MSHDLGPREPTTEPTGRRDDGGLTRSVVDGLTAVVLAIELDEQAELGPREVDPCNKESVAVFDDDLPTWRCESRYLPDELDHQGLEQALGRRRSVGPKRKDTTNPSDARQPARECSL
jgi:hypothetical protein